MTKFLFSFHWHVDAAVRHDLDRRPLTDFPAVQTRYGLLHAADNPANCYEAGLLSMWRFQLNAEASAELLQGVGLEVCRVERVELLLGCFGFLTVEVSGEAACGGGGAAGFKSDMVALANGISDNRASVERILASLEGWVSRRDDFSFGQPHFLVERGMCDASESYIFTYHTFCGSADEAAALREAWGYGDSSLSLEGNRTWQRFGHYVWLTAGTPDPELMHRLSFASVAAAWETLVFDNGANCYKNLLQLVRDDIVFDHTLMRRCINRDNLLLQQVSLSVRELTAEQLALTVRARREFESASREALFLKGQQALKYAIDGVDTRVQTRSSHMVEIILSILTAMSVYSVANDIYALITTGEEVISFHFVSTLLFAAATLVVAVLLVFVVKNNNNR